MKKLPTALFTVFAFALFALPCAAFVLPVSTPFSSIDELLSLYHSQDTTAHTREFFATAPLQCTGEVTLDETEGRVDILALGGLRVVSGGKLTLDNTQLVAMGPPPTITVEKGGTLIINALHQLTEQAMPAGGIVVEKGGTLLLADGFFLPEGVVADRNFPEPTPVPKPTPIPEPTPEPVPEPVGDFSGKLVNVSDKLWKLLFHFSALPEDAQHLYLWRSEDGENWKQCTNSTSTEAGGKDYLQGVNYNEGYGFFACWEETELDRLYFQMEVVGSTRAGMSNSVIIEKEMVGKPSSPDDPDPGDQGGNRGGGSQGSTDRVEQLPPEQKNTHTIDEENQEADGLIHTPPDTNETQVPAVEKKEIQEGIPPVNDLKNLDETEPRMEKTEVRDSPAVQPAPREDIPKKGSADQSGTVLLSVTALLALLTAGAVLKNKFVHKNRKS